MSSNVNAPEQAMVQRRRRGGGRTIRVLGQLEWKLTPADTQGHYGVLEATVPAGAGVPPHQHADPEAFYVLDGTLEVGRAGPIGLECFSATCGDLVYVPGHQVHAFTNKGTIPARILVMVTPGLAAFFEEAGVAVEPGAELPGPPSRGDVERVLAVARKHGHTFLQPS